jgi:hypothetical protein
MRLGSAGLLAAANEGPAVTKEIYNTGQQDNVAKEQFYRKQITDPRQRRPSPQR